MILKHIELRDWRSYESLSLDLPSGLTVIEGSNGAGKTNLAEAIYYLSLAHSWRVDSDWPLIREGCQEASLIAVIREGDLSRTIGITLTKSGKKISVNGKPIRRLSEMSSLVNVILFSPADTSIFTGSPGERRNFLDINLSKQSDEYFSLLGKYNHLLGERNASLKAPRPDERYIEVLTDEMIRTEKPLVGWRDAYVQRLNAVLTPLASSIFGSSRSVRLSYKAFLPVSDNFIEDAKNVYQRALESDLLHKSTSIGIHREDFSLALDGKNIGLYGSQGENRLAAIALKLSPYELIDDKEKKPIAVLDDVYSELDSTHAERLTTYLNNLGQTFVTAAKLDISGASYIEVADHKATRRN